MMIAAGGKILKIHMHTDLLFMESSLLSFVCAERKKALWEKKWWAERRNDFRPAETHGAIWTC